MKLPAGAEAGASHGKVEELSWTWTGRIVVDLYLTGGSNVNVDAAISVDVDVDVDVNTCRYRRNSVAQARSMKGKVKQW